MGKKSDSNNGGKERRERSRRHDGLIYYSDEEMCVRDILSDIARLDPGVAEDLMIEHVKSAKKDWFNDAATGNLMKEKGEWIRREMGEPTSAEPEYISRLRATDIEWHGLEKALEGHEVILGHIRKTLDVKNPQFDVSITAMRLAWSEMENHLNRFLRIALAHSYKVGWLVDQCALLKHSGIVHAGRSTSRGGKKSQEQTLALRSIALAGMKKAAEEEYRRLKDNPNYKNYSWTRLCGVVSGKQSVIEAYGRKPSPRTVRNHLKHMKGT